MTIFSYMMSWYWWHQRQRGLSMSGVDDPHFLQGHLQERFLGFGRLLGHGQTDRDQAVVEGDGVEEADEADVRSQELLLPGRGAHVPIIHVKVGPVLVEVELAVRPVERRG